MNASRVLRAMTIGLGVAGCGMAWGQAAYPVKPVRVIIVFPPGGATDIVGRLAFQKVGEQLNQQFIIDNRGGGGGTLGAAVVAKSPADGYTLMVYSATFIVNAHIYSKLPYDTMKDFVGITPVARMVGVLITHPSMPVKTVKEFIDLAKRRPGEINYSSAGNGAFQHLAGSYFANQTGIKITHVPYKGGALAAASVAAGETQAMFAPIPEAMPHMQSKRVRPVAVFADKRVAQFPDIPAINETVKGFELVSWMGTFAPAGTPSAIVERLNAELKKAVQDSTVASKLSAQTLDPMHLSVDEFAKLLRSEYEKYGPIVKASGARID
jgi:tripartite-type tricarboxylate transporter receptor subunit TctC